MGGGRRARGGGPPQARPESRARTRRNKQAAANRTSRAAPKGARRPDGREPPDGEAPGKDPADAPQRPPAPAQARIEQNIRFVARSGRRPARANGPAAQRTGPHKTHILFLPRGTRAAPKPRNRPGGDRAAPGKAAGGPGRGPPRARARPAPPEQERSSSTAAGREAEATNGGRRAAPGDRGYSVFDSSQTAAQPLNIRYCLDTLIITVSEKARQNRLRMVFCRCHSTE